jgi:hypothetical protein
VKKGNGAVRKKIIVIWVTRDLHFGKRGENDKWVRSAQGKEKIQIGEGRSKHRCAGDADVVLSVGTRARLICRLEPHIVLLRDDRGPSTLSPPYCTLQLLL